MILDLSNKHIFYTYPKRIEPPYSRMAHAPFCMYLIEVAKPKLLVELGAHNGNSYCAFCQAVKGLNINTQCYAIDTWEGDEQTGFYGPEVLEDLKAYHDPLYGSFSRLIQSTFDDSISLFSDKSIDFLHIDSCKKYESVKHDFETWLPKISDSGIVVFNNVNIKEKGFGVWKLWGELKQTYQSFEMIHGDGLGILALSSETKLNGLFDLQDEDLNCFRNFFYQLGNSIIGSSQKDNRNDTKIIEINKTFENRVRQYKQEILDYKNEIRQCELCIQNYENQLIQFQTSRALKVANWMRIVRLELLPEGSKREKLAKCVYHQLKKIFQGSQSNVGNIGLYEKWIKNNEKYKKREVKNKIVEFNFKPLISIILPVYNSNEKHLLECIQSVLHQYYQNWELCISDDCSSNKKVQDIVLRFAKKDKRIKYVFRKENGHISANSNSALALATGEFTTFLDHDDKLPRWTLFEVVKELNKDKNLDLIYSDEDKIDNKENRKEPHFKPDFSPNTILGTNYICHLAVYRTKLLREVGGLRKGFEGAQDYDLVLRFTERTQKIGHISKILYHWRMGDFSTAKNPASKLYAFENGKKALESALNRRNINGEVEHTDYPGYYHIKYDLLTEEKACIIIPTKDGADILGNCIDSIIKKTQYQNYEIIIINNNSEEKETFALFEELQTQFADKIRVIDINIPFNFSKINNLAVKETQAKYLLFLNNDTEVIAEGWLKNMIRFAQREEIGAVGAKLYYPDNTIQHSGVLLGIGGVAAHSHAGFPKENPGYFGKLILDCDYSAVTGACLMVKREDFEKVGGFKERLSVAFNDVDFCLRLFSQGKQNVCLHNVELYHYESKTRGNEDTEEKKRRFKKEIEYMKRIWDDSLNHDPFYNKNFSKANGNFSLDNVEGHNV